MQHTGHWHSQALTLLSIKNVLRNVLAANTAEFVHLGTYLMLTEARQSYWGVSYKRSKQTESRVHISSTD